VVAAGERDARVVGLMLFEVDPLGLVVQIVEVVGWLVLPAVVDYERPIWSQGVEEGAHDALGAADPRLVVVALR